jgi:hypothetical protein
MGVARWWDGQQWGPAAAPPPPPQREEDAGKALAMLSWLGYFVFYGIPALIVRVVEADGNRFARWHAAEAVNLQLTLLVVWVPVAVPAMIWMFSSMEPESTGPPLGFLLLWGAGMLLGLGTLVMVVLGAVRAGQGRWWRCPVAIPFLRRHRREGHR